MVAEWSTAISDACLALSGFHAARRVASSSFLASVGFGVVATAASCGSLRFGLSQPSYKIIRWHKYLSWLGGVAGLPLIASGYSRNSNVNLVANAILACSVAVLLLQKTLGPKIVAVCGDVLGAVSMAAILLVNIPNGNLYGLIGAALYLAGSILYKAEQSLGVIKPVDVFHYALMFGNVAMMLGLVKEPSPIFYKKS